MITFLRRSFIIAAFICLLSLARPVSAYSLLTHEQLIDLTWDSSIVPLLLNRFPTLTPEEIEQARAYAYGGCVIQDIGYYPLGDVFFSDLTHYVRSGDFVVNLFRNAGNANELAFAIGALSHYIGDSIGHSEATNLAVPIEFPKLRDKYGNIVNYAEGEHQHVQTEFAFDIDELAHHRFAPAHYLSHVGLQVPTRQLSLAFYQTYGLREDFTDTRHHRVNVRGYRFAVRNFIPRVAYAVTILHRRRETPDVTSDPDLKRLERELTAVAKKNSWDNYRKKNGVGTYSLAALIYITPKFGPFKLLAVKGPTVQTETTYIHSVIDSTDELRRTLRHFTPPPATRASAALAAASDSRAHPEASDKVPSRPSAMHASPSESHDPLHPLPNRDLDTGYAVRPSGYRLTDATYASLLHRLAQTPTVPVPPGIKEDILAYYVNLDLPFATKKDPAAWATVQTDLIAMRAMPTSNAPQPYATYADGDDDVAPASGNDNGTVPDAAATKPNGPTKDK